jgi:predicted nucleotidyltransferase
VRDLFARERSLPQQFVHDLAAAIRKEGDVKEAYLFGSAARGDMLPTSDIDIAIVSRKAAPEDSAVFDAVSTKYGNRVNLIRLRRGRGAGLHERIRVEGKALPLSRASRAYGKS